MSSCLSTAGKLQQDFFVGLRVLSMCTKIHTCNSNVAQRLLSHPGLAYGLQQKANIKIYMCPGQTSG